MGFREYKKCTPKCIACTTPEDLEKEINKIQKKYNIIDLQYSTHALHFDIAITQIFSALLLLGEKK